jgi:hypothetical protein
VDYRLALRLTESRPGQRSINQQGEGAPKKEKRKKKTKCAEEKAIKVNNGHKCLSNQIYNFLIIILKNRVLSEHV